MTHCPVEQRLADDVSGALARIVELSKAQYEAFHRNDEGELMRLDKELELAFGEKERSIGALRQHREEHGCWK